MKQYITSGNKLIVGSGETVFLSELKYTNLFRRYFNQILEEIYANGLSSVKTNCASLAVVLIENGLYSDTSRKSIILEGTFEGMFLIQDSYPNQGRILTIKKLPFSRKNSSIKSNQYVEKDDKGQQYVLEFDS